MSVERHDDTGANLPVDGCDEFSGPTGLLLRRRIAHLPVDLLGACGGDRDQVEVLLHRVRRVMGKGRLEAFSDGVLAIIITIMVLEMKVPHGETLEALLPLLPVFLSYVLSFMYVGI
jgi:Endosomal/lysosomal potassium channel TMEM175